MTLPIIAPKMQIFPNDNVTKTIGYIIYVTDTTFWLFFLLKAQKITDARYVNTRGQAYKVVYKTDGFITK